MTTLASEFTNSSSKSSSSSDAATRTFTFFNSSQNITVKLDRENYLLYEFVVLPLIEGNRLRISQKFISSINGVINNPDYEEWYSLDRLLIGWRRNAMSQDVSSQLFHCQSAYDLWHEAK